MKIYVKKVEGVVLPQKGSDSSAGYDIIAATEPKIVGKKCEVDESSLTTDWNRTWLSVDYIEYETNLYIAPDSSGIHTLIHPRSSISKYNLVLANSIGLIDNDYRGVVICRFKYVWQPEDIQFVLDAANKMSICAFRGSAVNLNKIYKKGDKIAQLVFEPTVQVEFELIDDLQSTQRGTGGFGSTDTIRIERPKTTENTIGGSTLAGLPPGIPPEQKIEVETDPKPKYSEDNKYVGQNSILEQWLKKGTHTAPAVSYEKLVKEREKGMS